LWSNRSRDAGFNEAEVRPFKIKEAVDRDSSKIEAIFRDVFGRTGAQYYGVRWDVEARRCVEQYYTLVAKIGKDLIGFVSTRFFKPQALLFPFKMKRQRMTFVIDWLVVLPGYQGRGVGTSLMKSTLSDLSRLSKEYEAFRDAVVLVRTSNWWEFTRGRRRRVPESRDSPAVEFYRKFGFKRTKGWMKLKL
jgi:ribosomal protein S18 acetylase RimI-like enzyme